MKRLELLGKKFGKWSVLEMLPIASGDRKVMWWCRCECGFEMAIAGTLLNCGSTSKCERCSKLKHGHAVRFEKSRTYASWNSMRQRCTNPHATGYRRYGGRGIKCCGRWDNFEAFLEDMGLRPEGTTLERIRNSEGYEPGNCRWATPLEQAQNMDKTKLVHFDGKAVSLRQASLAIGRTHSAISYYLDRHGLMIASGHILVSGWIPDLTPKRKPNEFQI